MIILFRSCHSNKSEQQLLVWNSWLINPGKFPVMLIDGRCRSEYAQLDKDKSSGWRNETSLWTTNVEHVIVDRSEKLRDYY